MPSQPAPWTLVGARGKPPLRCYSPPGITLLLGPMAQRGFSRWSYHLNAMVYSGARLGTLPHLACFWGSTPASQSPFTGGCFCPSALPVGPVGLSSLRALAALGRRRARLLSEAGGVEDHATPSGFAEPTGG